MARSQGTQPYLPAAEQGLAWAWGISCDTWILSPSLSAALAAPLLRPYNIMTLVCTPQHGHGRVAGALQQPPQPWPPLPCQQPDGSIVS